MCVCSGQSIQLHREICFLLIFMIEQANLAVWLMRRNKIQGSRTQDTVSVPLSFSLSRSWPESLMTHCTSDPETQHGMLMQFSSLLFLWGGNCILLQDSSLVLFLYFGLLLTDSLTVLWKGKIREMQKIKNIIIMHCLLHWFVFLFFWDKYFIRRWTWKDMWENHAFCNI